MFEHLLIRVGTMRIIRVDNVVSGEGDNVVENSLNYIIKVWVILSSEINVDIIDCNCDC